MRVHITVWKQSDSFSHRGQWRWKCPHDICAGQCDNAEIARQEAFEHAKTHGRMEQDS